MRLLRHDNHLLWFGVMAVISITLYFVLSYGATTTVVPTVIHQDKKKMVTNEETDIGTGTEKNEQEEQKQKDGDQPHQQEQKGKRRVTFDKRVQEEVRTQPKYVYLDLAKQDFLKDPFTGRVVLQLRPDVAPRTCANFVQLCEDKKYVNTPFHRVINDFMLQGGDIVHQDGTGSYSIYGGEGSTFDDEPFVLKHDHAGVLSMANSGPNTNGSQFFITTTATPHLDGKHVVFGKVVQGLEFVHDIEREMTDANNTPIRKCYIMNCGVLDVSELQQTPPQAPSQTSGMQFSTNTFSPMSSHVSQPATMNNTNQLAAISSSPVFGQSNTPPIEPSPFSLWRVTILEELCE